MSTKKAALICFLIFWVAAHATALAFGCDEHHQNGSRLGLLVRRDERRTLVSTEYGEVSAVEIGDGARGRYHLQFITLEPNGLFLPVLLHADMVFYVHTGSGTLSWVDDEEMKRLKLKKGDVYGLQSGTVFFLQSSLEPKQQKLRLHAIFTNSIEDLREPFMLAYSSIYDLILGFDKSVLRSAFKASEEVIAELTNGTKPPAIVHAVSKKGKQFWDFEAQFMKGLLGSKGYSMLDVSNKKHKTKAYNVHDAKPDFENCNGWSLTVTWKDLSALKGFNIGLFMVNLNKGAMMGPHWNPMAKEISIVLQGRGMIRVVCPSWANESECRNMSFMVEQDDVFAVPMFHPMAQMAFNNDSLVFVGFSTTTKKNHPQYMAGKASVLQTLDREIVAASLNVADKIVDKLLDSEDELVILDCTSCAEEEAERAIEEARKREEEKREEEEEARKREEEEERRQEEEAERAKEERRKKEEEGKRRRKEEEEAEREEEERKKEEEEEQRRREEEEAEKEEEERRKQKEKARKRKEEEGRRREEKEGEAEEREEAKRKEEERRRREEEKARKREEEEARRREEEQKRREEARKREEEEEERGRGEGEAEEEEEARQQGKSRRERKRQQEEEGEGESEGGGWRDKPRKILKKIWKV
ncbi:vicilin-like seed storage protein At2g18540 isoform X2 [Diospyros lotus]|uniref:vicilin-like seed storage protein At2g18540 isoform X2 n=1 Tax=Diospyros lotus TaxID=55363 RepID=UPI00225B025B|nr:vicilin-like seed storage protein At2g18540 isoform X2 [Diospyros lotus]